MLKQRLLKTMYPSASRTGEQFGAAWAGLLAVFFDQDQAAKRPAAIAEFRAVLPDYLELTRAKPRDADEWITVRLRAAMSEPAGDAGEALHQALIAALTSVWAASPRAVAMAPDIAALVGPESAGA